MRGLTDIYGTSGQQIVDKAGTIEAMQRAEEGLFRAGNGIERYKGLCM